MIKWIFWLLLSANAVFFAVMNWGSLLTSEANVPIAPAAINSDKIKIVSMLASSSPASAVSIASAVASAVAMTLPASVPSVASLTPPAKPICLEWGEFSGADLQRADAALSAMKLGDKLTQRIVEHSSGYWVYIPPMKTRGQIQRMVKSLQEVGIDDYFVVQEAGAWKNAISLGVFKTEESAQKYLLKVHEVGFKSAKMAEHASKLKFTVFLLSRLDSVTAAQIEALRKDFHDSELKQAQCN